MSVPALPTSPLIKALQAKNVQVQKTFADKHGAAKKWLARNGLLLPELRAHSAKLLTGATLSSALLLASPHFPLIGTNNSQVVSTDKTADEFLKLLRDKPELTAESEIMIEEAVKKYYSLTATFELDNNRIPTYFGKVGLEQHLYRFPGDTLHAHGAFIGAGIAPAQGAFGYFSDPGKPLKLMEEEEKFYLVLQTFLIPEWNSEWKHLKEWYKFRKFLMINPANGRAVVGILGDSGPGVSAGKVFGASPEAMAGLGFYPRATRGDVVVLFLDDPGNEVRLGPVFLNEGNTL
jgi:hypothetical protein